MDAAGRHTILFSFAHPDDESFSGAGTAMKYAARGARTVLLTATRGDRGKAGDPPVCPPDQVAARREQELREAAAIIGFDELHLPGYRDRELADAPIDEMRWTLVSLIRRVRPAIVITFDPNGYNRHPDHVAISRFTSDAIAVAADPRWHAEAGPAFAVPRLLWTPPLAPWNAAGLGRLDDHPGVDFVVDVAPWRDRRIAALRAHRTQHLSVDKHFFDQPDPGRILDREIWRQAWGPPLGSRPSEEIFEGL
jgi:LmbE family N-acetylglucosaminyl deacetylase